MFYVEQPERMAKIIAFCNQKGGVGKTTTAVNIGAYWAIAGKRTLLFDLDPQGNASISCGMTKGAGSRALYEAMISGGAIEGGIINSAVDRLELIPSTPELALIDIELSQAKSREGIIKKLCEPIRSRYDAILFDCPPSLGLLTVNALVAADCVIIPVQCEYLSLEGLNALLQSIERIKTPFNPSLTIGAIILTMVDFRANLTKEVIEEVRRFFKDLVCEHTVPRNIRLAESPSFGKPICAYDPHSTGALAYEAIANELSVKMLEKDMVGQPT